MYLGDDGIREVVLEDVKLLVSSAVLEVVCAGVFITVGANVLEVALAGVQSADISDEELLTSSSNASTYD